MVNVYRRRFNDVEIALRQPGLSPAKEQDLRKEWRQLLEQIVGCYSTILPFEKAKLTTIKVSGDPNAPHYSPRVGWSRAGCLGGG